jgi:2-C-methyl-D-erythritol 4-phosphate cytidylyltransferase/2-C-methyl-D-erythritol 2,4-cyclodiphosphate synthase
MDNNSAAIVALIVAGGEGARFAGGSDHSLPKQYHPLLGQSVLSHSLRRLSQHPGIGHVYVAIRPEHRRHFSTHDGMENVTVLETPGDTRQETVRQSLQAIGQARRVIIHDAARPCWSAKLLDRLLAAEAPAVSPALAVSDTLRRLQDGASQTIDRQNMHLVQTPQVFDLARLKALHEAYKDEPVTDDAALFEKAGETVFYIAGERQNLKITLAGDMDDAAAALAALCGDIRTATGYDVHEYTPATPARPMRLGGVTIPHERALKGHSDADAVLHAITDALLGCISAEDIGHHFSPRDDRWKDADSTLFLAHARDMVAARGGLIMHVDTTVICEEPKIGPHRAAMQVAIAGILRIAPARVSIKATTSEGLGFTGRREGLAAQASATVRLPFFSFNATKESSIHA